MPAIMGPSKLQPDSTIEAFKEKQPMMQCRHLLIQARIVLTVMYFLWWKHPSKFSIEFDFFPHLVGKGFYAFEVENRFIDIGTPERYSWAQEHLKH